MIIICFLVSLSSNICDNIIEEKKTSELVFKCQESAKGVVWTWNIPYLVALVEVY